MDRVFNVLFLCTANSARSVIGEALTTHLGRGRFKGYSAGSQPRGQVNPYTLRLLAEMGIPTEGFRSKSWDEFAAPGAPQMDFIITVCDSAANETCPVWPGHPATAHWGVFDPAAVQGTDAEIMRAFRDAAHILRRRIELFQALPLASLDRVTVKARMDEIARMKGAQV